MPVFISYSGHIPLSQLKKETPVTCCIGSSLILTRVNDLIVTNFSSQDLSHKLKCIRVQYVSFCSVQCRERL